MRQFTCILSCLLLCCLCACQHSQKDTSAVDAYNEQGYQIIPLDREKSIVAMYDKKLVYFQKKPNRSGRSISCLDLYTMSEKEIGAFESYTIRDNSFAAMDHSILFHVGSGPYDDLTTTLYEIDLQNYELRKVYSEKFYQTLVPIKSSNNKAFSMKGILSKEDSDIGITYIDILTRETMHPQTVIEKGLHMKTGIGESILAFDAFEERVAVLVSQDTGSGYHHVIEVYDPNFEQLQRYPCNYILSNLGNQSISEFIFYGDSAFIQNLSNDSVFITLDESSQDLLATANFEYALYPAAVIGETLSPYELFFAPYTPFLFAYDPVGHRFRVLDLSDSAPGYSFANHRIYCSGDDFFCVLVQNDTAALDIPSSDQERIGIRIRLQALTEAFDRISPLETGKAIDLSGIVREKYLFNE